jgi:hypothetical protein
MESIEGHGRRNYGRNDGRRKSQSHKETCRRPRWRLGRHHDEGRERWGKKKGRVLGFRSVQKQVQGTRPVHVQKTGASMNCGCGGVIFLDLRSMDFGSAGPTNPIHCVLL